MSKRRSESEWAELLQAYANRDCTQDAFCKNHGISAGTLKYHLDRSASSFSKFVPALTAPNTLPEVCLELPSGLRLTIRG